jgi:hypothetical protein
MDELTYLQILISGKGYFLEYKIEQQGIEVNFSQD